MALDLDGTLLGPGDTLAEEARVALGALAARGVVVALATGRMLCSAAGVQERLGVPGPVVAYNGGLIRLPDGRAVEHPVALEDARLVGRVCRERGWYLQSYQGDALFVPEDEPRAREYGRIAGVPYTVDPRRVWAPEVPPLKLLVIEPAERQPEVRQGLGPLVRGRLELANSYAHYLEITAAGVDKGTALAELCHLLGIDAGEVLAVGDGENDLPMLRFAGMGVAVGNASPAVRQAAPRRASAPFGRGVVEAVAMAEAM